MRRERRKPGITLTPEVRTAIGTAAASAAHSLGFGVHAADDGSICVWVPDETPSPAITLMPSDLMLSWIEGPSALRVYLLGATASIRNGKGSRT